MAFCKVSKSLKNEMKHNGGYREKDLIDNARSFTYTYGSKRFIKVFKPCKKGFHPASSVYDTKNKVWVN